MASKNILRAKIATNFVNTEAEISRVDGLFEFEESDVWNINNNINNSSSVSQFEVKKMLPRKGGSRSMVVSKSPMTCASSLPVNIPDWSKIYRVDHNNDHQDSDHDHDHDGGDYDEHDHDSRVPIHEYLARRRGASFSVHEGIGRTLKGRDLRQVRNAIWKKVGFED